MLALGMFLVAAVGVWAVLQELGSPDPWAGVRRLLALGAAISMVGVDAPAAALLILVVVFARAREVRPTDHDGVIQPRP